MADNPAIKGTLDGFLVAVLGVKRSVIKAAIKAGRVRTSTLFYFIFSTPWLMGGPYVPRV